MKRKQEKVLTLVGVYLMIKDSIEKKNDYEIFKKIYIDKKHITLKDMRNKYYICNAAWWKETIERNINSLQDVDLNKLFDQIIHLCSTK